MAAVLLNASERTPRKMVTRSFAISRLSLSVAAPSSTSRACRSGFVLPNERGRVLMPDGEPLRGVYAVGWIKRGATGIPGTNKRDGEETVSCLVDDLRAGADGRRP